MELILLRHGQSLWNKTNRFTGWVDIALSEQGKDQAYQAAALLKSKQLIPDRVYSSMLQRSIQTLWRVLEGMGTLSVSIEKTWMLNERHYGDLQGQNKAAMIERHGAGQVHAWRRGFAIAPPPLTKAQHIPEDWEVPPEYIPVTESLKDTQRRVLTYWEQELRPQAQKGLRLLVCSHGNTLRALLKSIVGISDHDIESTVISTGQPMLCRLDAECTKATLIDI